MEVDHDQATYKKKLEVLQQQEELIEDEKEQEMKEEEARRALKEEEEARLAEKLLPESEVMRRSLLRSSMTCLTVSRSCNPIKSRSLRKMLA